MKIRAGIYGVMFILLSWLPAKTAENYSPSANRQAIQDALRDLASPMFTERVKGLQKLNSLLDPQLFDTFKIPDKVRAIAENVNEPAPVRIEALRALINYNQNGVAVPRLLELLTDIINKDQFVRVVNAALDLIADTAPATGDGKTVNLERDRAFAALQALFKQRAKWPVSTQLVLLSAIGNFPEKPGVISLMQNLAFSDSESREVRLAAVKALGTTLSLQNTGDKKIADTLQAQLVKSQDLEIRLAILEALEIVCANMPVTELNNYRPNAALQKEINAMLHSGEDGQVIPAVKFLMRMSGADAKIVDELLAASVPNAAGKPSMTAIAQVNSALVNALHNIGNNRANSVQAQKIIGHLLDLLSPDSRDVIPADIRETAILGLGIIPPIFDRREAVASLIALLEIEVKNSRNGSGEQIQMLEDSLAALTGQPAFRTFDRDDDDNGRQRLARPDIAAWNRWYGQNKGQLAGR